MRAADVHQGQHVLWFDTMVGQMVDHQVTDRVTWPNGRVTLRLKGNPGRPVVKWTGDPSAEILEAA